MAARVAIGHQQLLERNPSTLRVKDSPNKVYKLSELLGEAGAKEGPSSVLFDKDERELLKMGDSVSGEQMFHLLETKRFKELQGQAINLQGDLLYNRRCPKCTLIPPCKHYQSQDEIVADVKNFVSSDNFRSHLSPKKRQSLMRAAKDSKVLLSTFNQT